MAGSAGSTLTSSSLASCNAWARGAAALARSATVTINRSPRANTWRASAWSAKIFRAALRSEALTSSSSPSKPALMARGVSTTRSLPLYISPTRVARSASSI